MCLAAWPAGAEDLRGRWSLGFSAGVLSTKDNIRSNAAGVLLNEFGRPEDISDDIIPPHEGSVDLRQDDLLGRETEVEERQIYSFSAAYGLTSWLSLQFDLGYYRGNVSNLDTFRIGRAFVDEVDGSLNNVTIEDIVTTPVHDASFPISAGRLEQIPVSLSAVFRFRKDSPFNPILGAGVGFIFTDFEESDAFRDMNDAILRGFQRTQVLLGLADNRQIIRDRFGGTIGSTTCAEPANQVGHPEDACILGAQKLEEQIRALEADPTLDPATREFYIQITREQFAPYINEAFIPRKPFITTHVEDAFEYHFIGGAEYHFNEHWSAFVLGRYQFSRANLEIRISDNGNTVINPFTGQPVRFETDQARFVFLSESNCDSLKQQQAVSSGEAACLSQPNLVNDEITVQSGEINLSGFTLAFGVRFTF